jgi:hypothetical protein
MNPYVQVMAWEFAGLDIPKDILKVIEKPEDIMEEDEKSIWTRWIIKPFNYIANRVREFLGSRSAK